MSKVKYKVEVGEIRVANSGCYYKIIEQINPEEFLVEFQDSQKFRKIFQKYSIIRERLWNPYYPTVFGVGYFGEGRFSAKVNTGTTNNSKRNTKEYNAWINMLQRCYYDKYICRVQGYSAYDKVTVCDEWHNFQTFAEWYHPRLTKLQDVGEHRYHLDKDLLSKGFGEIYSPDTCCVIPMSINAAMINQQIKDEKTKCIYKSEHTGGYNLVILLGGIQHRKSFDSIEEAESARIELKKAYMKSLAEKYKDFIEDRVYTSLCTYDKF